MPGYVDSLPADANMGTVFDGMHQEVQALLSGFANIEPDEYGRNGSTRQIPDVDLLVRDVRGQSGEPHKMTFLNAAVAGANNRLVEHNLLVVAGVHNFAYPPPLVFSVMVGGFRGGEERRGAFADYRLSRKSMDHKGLTEAILGHAGVGSELDDEPTGTTAEKPTRKVADFDVEGRQRIHVITRGILDN